MKAAPGWICIGLVLSLAACDEPAEKPVTPPVEDAADISAEAASASIEASAVSSESVAETAPEMPSGRAGLWQLTQTLPQMDGHSVSRICVDEAQGARLALIGQDLPGKPEMIRLECSARQVSKSGDSADIDTVCMVNGTTLTSHIHTDIVGDDAFHQTVETRYSPAFAGHGNQVTVTDGKRLGACPTGMKPGDYITGDGVRLKAGPVLAKFR